MFLSPSTKRALRTIYQGVVALVTVVPLVVAVLPSDSPLAVQLASVVAAVGVVSKVINVLEDNGYLPAWLKE
jgi:hypothetical protein